MSTKYPGGFITKSPVAPTSTAASGVWTLDQQQQAQRAGTWPAPPVFIEDVFQTWLYSGTSAAQTINNGIDLAGNGGLVWSKGRNLAGYNNCLMDTARSGILFSDTTQSANDYPTDIQSYNSNGFTLKAQASSSYSNIVGTNYASWTFREQPKFFDVVTYTGNGVSGRKVAHSLGSVPGAIFVKATSDASDWCCMVRASNTTYASFLSLNTTGPAAFLGTLGDPPTSTEFTTNSLGNSAGTYTPNVNGVTYVAYLFAHNAGGFGLTGNDNVISCGSYTGNGSSSGPTVSLGYEPQWIMIKQASGTNNGSWCIQDSMRGMTVNNNTNVLFANSSSGEINFRANFGTTPVSPNATGFQITTASSGPGDSGSNYNINGVTYVYIAIRRGPMKTPTTGTSVFNAQTSSGAAGTQITTAFPVDLVYALVRTAGEHDMLDRLRGISNSSAASPLLDTTSTNPEVSQNVVYNADQNTGFRIGTWFGGISNVFYAFQRAPSFFDEVCYTGTGSARTVAHNLTVVPELIIVRVRSASASWIVYSAALGATRAVFLNSTAAQSTSAGFWNNTAPTSTVFTVGNDPDTNNSGGTMVAYLFASCPGVSKVGTFTGTGATQVINCGFTGGARFVLIKATSTTGDWYVWDSARGIVAGNDPYLELNTTDAEVTNTDWVDTAATGFELSNNAGNLANSNGVSYIFLAIA